MKKQFTFFVFLILLSVSVFSQNWTKISSDNPVPIQKQLIESSDQRIVIKFNLEGFFMTPVETPRGTEYQISVPDMVFINDKSMPELPMHGVSAIIPDLALMNVRILSSDYTDFTDMDIAPSKGHYTRSEDPEKIPFTYGYAYAQDEFYPNVLSELREPYIFRDYRGQTLVVYPISYNPVQRILRVYHDITFEIYNDGIGGANQYIRDGVADRMVREFKEIYNSHFINVSQTRYPILEEEGDLLIICHGPWVDAVQPLVEWKKTIGRHTEIVDVSTIGTTSTAIKAFVTNYYNTNGLTHLLLVGDHQHVPSHPMSGGYSDSFYGYILGNDSYSEVFVGRFSAESLLDVQTQVQRTIHYERDINESDTWLSTGIGIARNEGAGGGHNGGEADYVHMDFIRDSLLNYTYNTVYREYDGNVPGVPNTNAAQISQRINEGASIINYCNHGSMTSWSVANYNTTHVSQLTNVGKLPYIWAVACDNGKFTAGTCFAEVWMRSRHSTTGDPVGAIATLMSWVSQLWQPPMTGQDEMVTILVEKRNHIKRTMGGVSINGSAKMIEAHGSSGQSTHDTWILFGDPSLTLRTANPTVINATHMPTLFLGSTEFTVNADAEDAIVSLTIDGEILGTAYVNNGSATVQFPTVTTPGVMTVAVFGYNRVVYLQEVEVIPASGPYLVYSSSIIDDAIGGNGDGQIDFGESIVMGVELKNIGIEQGANLVVNLTSTSPYVTITDGVENYGNILPDQLVMIEDAFAFTVADNVPNNTAIQFDLQITDGQETWTSAFSKTAYAPQFTIGNMTIMDPTGNSNGQIDPGETVDVKIPTTNSGNSLATDLQAILTCTSPYVTVNVGNATIASLEPDQTSDAVFTISVDESTPIGTPISLEFEITSGEYSGSKTFITQVGLIFEDFESGDFSIFPWANGGNLPWTITSSDPYQGTYSAKSGAISHNQTSLLILDYDVGTNDSISFYRKVSSENNYDHLKFYINDQVVGQWSGTVPWGRVVFPVTAGVKTFKWEYMKDISVSSGLDCAWIDYIVFPPPSPCPSPVNLHVTAVTANSATLNWTPGGSESTWDIKWGAAGFNPNTGGTLVENLTTPSYNLTGLNAVTSYDFYVRSKCVRDMHSAWNGPANFTTLCDIFSLPYFEPFGTPTVSCWSFPEGQGNWDFGSSYTPPSASAPNAYFGWSPSITNYSHPFTSPLFNGVNFSEIKLDFKLYINNFSTSTVEQMAVEYKTLDQTQWTLLENFNNSGGTAEFVRVNKMLTGMAGQEFQVRFRAHGANSYNINGWGLDEIKVHGEELPDILPGDSNCDGVVSILDVIVTVNYAAGLNPEPFCFENADINNDDIINVLDVIGTVNIVLRGTKSAGIELNSESAHLFMNNNKITIQSDGTLAGIQFEILGMDQPALDLALEGFELFTNIEDNKLIGMIFSMDNKPIPAGEITLLYINKEYDNLNWGDVVAGNLNADEVKVIRHNNGHIDITNADFGLRAFPNPSHGEFVVETELPLVSNVQIRILNMMGAETMVLYNGFMQNGSHRFVINESNKLSPGVYFLQYNATPVDSPGSVINKYQRLIIN